MNKTIIYSNCNKENIIASQYGQTINLELHKVGTNWRATTRWENHLLSQLLFHDSAFQKGERLAFGVVGSNLWMEGHRIFLLHNWSNESRMKHQRKTTFLTRRRYKSLPWPSIAGFHSGHEVLPSEDSKSCATWLHIAPKWKICWSIHDRSYGWSIEDVSHPLSIIIRCWNLSYISFVSFITGKNLFLDWSIVNLFRIFYRYVLWLNANKWFDTSL
jgi:hypothetical protein